MKFTSFKNAREVTGLSYIGGINISSKLIKNKKVDHTLTYCIYLAPASQSGYNVCSHATDECKIGCLASTGRAGMELVAGIDRIKNARIKKTKLLIENQDFFMGWVIAEINSKKEKAEREGYKFSIRMNGTSDVDWTKVMYEGKNIFEIFSDCDFYDYTKNPGKFFNKPKNYHLTFSYTGKNWNVCELLLKKNENVAVIFDIPKSGKLPETFNGYNVIDGDVSDSRNYDAKGVVVGLRWKNIGDKEANSKIKKSVFVVH